MIKYIIFGAGITGKRALAYLGDLRTECFISNYKEVEACEGKIVRGYNELPEFIQEYHVIVIASEKYYQVMEEQIKNDNYKRYFVYHEIDDIRISGLLPGYFLHRCYERINYNRALSVKNLNKYQSIVIYGDNACNPYLLCEIAMQHNLGFAAIKCIIGNTDKKEELLNIPYMELNVAINDIDCLLVTERRTETDIYRFIDDNDYDFDVIDLYDVDCCEQSFSHPELIKYRNIHEGKRIWLIGNGPSLRLGDLETLARNNEICIAFNMIFKIFEKTVWRPNYIGITDSGVLYDCLDIDKYIENIGLFVADGFMRDTDYYLNRAEYVHLNIEDYNPSYPNFSEDITKEIYWGSTVSYDIGLQFAHYMGAVQIFLLGMDNSYQGSVADEKSHFIKDYHSKELKKIYNEEGRTTNWDKINCAYEKAELYSRKHGFRIFNATRGGKLEAFERVDFDSLFDTNYSK